MDSFIKYLGGKSKLRDEIISIIPPHNTFVEVFCGASWLLFKKPRSPIEFINDIDNELINLYNVIKNKHHEFIEYLDMIPISEVLYKKYNDQQGIPISPMDCIPEVAANLYYIIMNSFNGNISGKPSFALNPNRRSSFIRFYTSDWQKIANRLKEVTILNKDYKEIIKRLDSKDTLFYLDPPYICATDNNKYYKHSFTEKDHKTLMVYLTDIKGKFILSYGNDKKINELYEDFNIIELSEKELIITNYEVSKTPFYSSREGIPKRAPWNIANCPYCGSRELQQVSKRITLESKSRTWKPCGYICRDCKELFRSS